MMYKTHFPNEHLEESILCHNYTVLDERYRQNNARNFDTQVFVPQYYKCDKDFANENAVLFSTDNRSCDKNVIMYRGMNNKPPVDFDKKKTDFLIPHCDCNTYNNVVICDKKKCCQKSHQLFCNMTRRNGPTKCQKP